MKRTSLFFLLFICCYTMNGQEETPTTDSIPDTNGDIPILSLSETELEADDEFENISGILASSRDPFTSAAAFNWGISRFRIRGYDNNNTDVFINGSYMNDLETGRTFWSAWGGLNDVLRSREMVFGLNASDFTHGGINGAINMDVRASAQRKQLRISYASSNRSYFHRIMGVYTPTLSNGWSLTLSGSRRWADEGYIEGTFYDSWSYFLGVSKKFGKQELSLNVLGSPTKRGRSGGSVQEMYDIAGTNYYNSFWGYQNGEKRNSRVGNAHQPISILQHKWEIGETSNLTTTVSYQFGRNGSTALDWNNARDPRPDYYRYLPSYVRDPNVAQTLYSAMAADENLRQLDWGYMYNANWYTAPTTITDVNGIEGNDVTGIRSKYIVEDRRFDKKKADLNLVYNKAVGDNVKVNFGYYYRWQKTRNHKVVDDLMGGDFYLDTDRFSERDFPDNPDVLQNDLDNPNRIVREGETFGYDYYSNINKTGIWLQQQLSLDKVDLFMSLNAGRTQFWRTGNFRNGRFPESSLGDSEKQNFFDLAAKLGAVYKINGRNYLYANAGYLQRPPSYRDAYLSPRTRDQVAPNLTTEKIISTEGGYQLKSPAFKGRATAYYTKFEDGVSTRSFYHDIEQTFVNFTLNGIDKQHFGIELAAEAKVMPGLTLHAVTSIGQYTYTNRPKAYITQDNSSEFLAEGRTIYQKNFYVGGTPQHAYNIGASYRSTKFWFANVNFSYFNEIYLNFNPDRRTAAAVEDVEYEGEYWTSSVNQEKLASQISLDLFGGKSFKIKNDYFIYLTVGVSNVLNNKNFITGGFEQSRFAAENVFRFPSRYYYAYGVNYFASIAFRY